MTQKQRFSKPIKRQTLAEQVAEAIEESIIVEDWKGGDPLPTEPELAEQFGVSRAVIRDATRMLVARGLVDAQHGRGVFVTESQTEAFGEALLLALRRVNATVWDVEHFEQIIYPEVFALAAVAATDDEFEQLQTLVDEYAQIMKKNVTRFEDDEDSPSESIENATATYRNLISQIFAMTHNQLFKLLATPLVKLHSFRNWQDDDTSADELMKIETAYFQAVLDAISSRDPVLVRRTMRKLMELPPEAIQAMRSTPVGEVPIIPIAYQIPRNN